VRNLEELVFVGFLRRKADAPDAYASSQTGISYRIEVDNARVKCAEEA
jgi:hypothetical protein